MKRTALSIRGNSRTETFWSLLGDPPSCPRVCEGCAGASKRSLLHLDKTTPLRSRLIACWQVLILIDESWGKEISLLPVSYECWRWEIAKSLPSVTGGPAGVDGGQDSEKEGI